MCMLLKKYPEEDNNWEQFLKSINPTDLENVNLSQNGFNCLKNLQIRRKMNTVAHSAEEIKIAEAVAAIQDATKKGFEDMFRMVFDGPNAGDVALVDEF